MRAILAAAGDGQRDAILALDVYHHRLRAAVASMAAALGGLDALVFTGGVGENAAAVRERAGRDLAFLGVAVDPGRNVTAAVDREIGAPGAAVRTFVIAAREDVQIAHEVRDVLGATAAGDS